MQSNLYLVLHIAGGCKRGKGFSVNAHWLGLDKQVCAARASPPTRCTARTASSAHTQAREVQRGSWPERESWSRRGIYFSGHGAENKGDIFPGRSKYALDFLFELAKLRLFRPTPRHFSGVSPQLRRFRHRKCYVSRVSILSSHGAARTILMFCRPKYVLAVVRMSWLPP